MSDKDLLGTLSPVYGMATGHGLFGQNVGTLPAIAKAMRDSKDDEEEAKKTAGQMPATGMKKGGKVSSASSRADGCAVRGKTRGKIV